jgi:hypothetical protein
VLKYLRHTEIDLAQWDNCVQNSAQQMIYAYSGYLGISAQNCWDAIVEIQHGNYVSVFPLPYKKRLGIQFIYQPLHSQQLGLFTTAESQETSVASYLALIPPHFRKIYLQLNTDNTFAIGGLPKGFSSVPRITYHLDLAKPYEELKENYATNLKRNLKKAEKESFEIAEGTNIVELIALYRQTRGKDLKEVKDRHYKLIEKQYAFLQKNSLVRLLEIRDNGKLIAGALFLVQPGKLIFLFSAASEVGKKHGAMAFIINSLIKEYAGSETVLDFEGSSIPNLARFYGSFGAKPVTYLSVSRNNLQWYLKWLIK